jgi:hypothetical protein
VATPETAGGALRVSAILYGVHGYPMKYGPVGAVPKRMSALSVVAKGGFGRWAASELGLGLYRVSRGSSRPPTLCSAGGHPWTGLMAGPGMVTWRASLLTIKLL